jgi:hypothetical protein
LDEEKSKHVGLAHQIGFLPQHNCTVCLQVARERRQERRAPTCIAYKSVGNKYDLTSVSDWPVIMIGSGGLLVVVLHLCVLCCVGSVSDPAQYNLDEENSKYAGLAHQNSLGSA